MNKGVLKLILKFSLLAPPFIGLFVLYFYLDPFKVVHSYNFYYPPGSQAYVSINRDYVSTQTFIDHYQKYKWDSFIFGNSRSRFFEAEEWKKYIHSNACFHYDASSESLLGIYQKIKFLHDNKYSVKNALLVVDNLTLPNVEEKKGHLYMSHPILSGQNKLAFQFEYFVTFLSPKFWLPYFDLLLTQRYKAYMWEVFETIPIDYEIKYNEVRFSYYEKLISENPDLFYTQKRIAENFANKRPLTQRYSQDMIFDKQYKLLGLIRDFLKEEGTDYEIIINPLYDQIRISQNDLSILRELFGTDKVHDFSGINSITSDYRNYYENSHYRPHIARFILQSIYR